MCPERSGRRAAFSENGRIINKQNGAARLLRFVYMVEDKMKKMKNCYLRVL